MTRHTLKLTATAALMLGVASPAFAQDNLCGGAGSGGIWIGDDAANSDLSVADNYREQMALVLGGNEYVSIFSLSEPTSVRVEAEGRGSGDPIIDLLDSDGGVILSDDDSGGNAALCADWRRPGQLCTGVNRLLRKYGRTGQTGRADPVGGRQGAG